VITLLKELHDYLFTNCSLIKNWRNQMPLTVPDVVFKTRVNDESIGGDNPSAGRMSVPITFSKAKKWWFWRCPALSHPLAPALIYRDLLFTRVPIR
jgi:hypothetical protein